MSYYSERAICKRLNVSNIYAVRDELIATDLLAYAKPIYQVLALPTKTVNYKPEVKMTTSEKPATKEEISAMVKKFNGGWR